MYLIIVISILLFYFLFINLKVISLTIKLYKDIYLDTEDGLYMSNLTFLLV